MTVTIQPVTLDDYLSYSDGTDNRYELVNGALVRMAQPKGRHGAIAEYLNDIFRAEIKRLGYNWTAKQMAIALQSPRGGRWDTARIPDVMVLSLAQWHALRDQEAIIRLNEPPPFLVVEVVSASTTTVDYRAKRVEYNVLNIPEYWIVDPLESVITLLRPIDDLYEAQAFRGNDEIASATFPELPLTVEQILAAEEA
ncbi:Uma2 family endonuclease [Leptolyngbya sp. PCC 6406]|uniref:Uma2 family endonuclease n=1 Tax=Leptolyngbya sp. PCC 6406 TaxID=1173264 RepID=UPI0002ABC6B7|nr:Uma2 family endonuclease [Leptolyngbya sp. PCC 6406]